MLTWTFVIWTNNLLKYPELDLVWILIFVSILLNCLKPQEKIIISIWNTVWNFSLICLVCRCIVELIESSVSFASVLLNYCKSENTLLVSERTLLSYDTRLSCFMSLDMTLIDENVILIWLLRWKHSLRKLNRRDVVLTIVLLFIEKIEGIIVRGIGYKMTWINFTCQR